MICNAYLEILVCADEEVEEELVEVVEDGRFAVAAAARMEHELLELRKLLVLAHFLPVFQIHLETLFSKRPSEED